MKKVLFILGSYFPEPSPNGICVKQITNELKKNGIEVTILATKSTGLKDLEEINGIDVYRVNDRWINTALGWCKNKKSNSSLIKYIERLLLLINKLKNIMIYPIWPLVSPLYSYRYYKKTKYLHTKKEFDAIISVYAPIDALIAGALTKKNSKNTKLFLYFLDNLSGGIAPKHLSDKWLEKRGFSWEKHFFDYADKIYIMESHKEHYFKNKFNEFKSKIEVVDIPLMREIKSDQTTILNSNKINLVYTGSISKKVKNPKYMLELYKELNKNKEYKLHLFGGGDSQVIIDHYQKADESIITYGQVNVDKVYNVLHESDILINIGSSVETQIPSKIFEYIAVGKPIISFYKTIKEPSLPYLKKYPLSLLIEENFELLEENTKAVDLFVKENLAESIKYDDIKNLYTKNMPKDLTNKIINEII